LGRFGNCYFLELITADDFINRAKVESFLAIIELSFSGE
jgi:hypothetical protein